ncbi:hypothetical protein [Alkalicoccobacillus gibsonii]|uniref:hypothetical protein n=1 Tax=Alkalicoccobacillus gibsonii TaxID=79881 RepID=UPI001931800F|nr:hypothetical protein [Alkalicoccobacillus gibsonii]MBM0066422.1 hypothetical protein [Alkalicoccobacillus gibsonii]
MKKVTAITGMVSFACILVGCNTSNEQTQNTESVENNTEEQTEGSGTDTQEDKGTDTETVESSETDDLSDTEDEKEEAYEEVQESENYMIQTDYVDATNEFITTFSISREGDIDGSREERLERSLFESDPSEQDILSTYTELTLEDSVLTVQFNVSDEQLLSTTSAQNQLFYQSFSGISDLYGVEKVIFLDPNGGREMIVGGSPLDQTMNIEEERGQTRGYYTLYDTELEQTLFLPGGLLGEDVTEADGEPLSFEETVEEMKTVNDHELSYSTAIVEGMAIDHASIENDVATVRYTVDEEIVTESDQIVFANAMQLAALDFHATELELVNETERRIVNYPLIK